MRQVPSKHLQAGFDSRHPLFCARRSAADRRDDTPELAGSIPVAHTTVDSSIDAAELRGLVSVVFVQRSRTPASQAGNTGSIPVHDARTTPSSKGSGCDATNIVMGVRVLPESLMTCSCVNRSGRDLDRGVIWDQLGFQNRSAGFDPSTACYLDSLRSDR